VGGTERVASGAQLGDITADSTGVYFTDGATGVLRLASDGAPTVIAASPGAVRLAASGGEIFFTNLDRGDVESVPEGGGAVTTLAQVNTSLAGIAADAAGVVVADVDGRRLAGISVSGGPPVTLATLTDLPQAVVIDAASIVASDMRTGGGGAIVRVPRAGGAVVPLATTSSVVEGLVLAGHAVHWSDGHTLWRTPVGGGASTALVTAHVGGTLTIGGGGDGNGSVLYFVTSEHTIASIPMGGGQAPQILFGPLTEPTALAASAGAVYAIESHDCGGPNGMAIERAPETQRLCRLATCPSGARRASDQVHCCPPGQDYHAFRGQCVRVPPCAADEVVVKGECQYPVVAPASFAADLLLHDGTLYVADISAGAIDAVTPQGRSAGSVQTLVSGLEDPTGLAADDSGVYFTEYRSDDQQLVIEALPTGPDETDGTNGNEGTDGSDSATTVRVTDISGANCAGNRSLAVTPDAFFLSDGCTHALWRYPRNGDPGQKLAATAGTTQIGVARGYVFYAGTDAPGPGILRVPVAGGTPTLVASAAEPTGVLALSDQRVYFGGPALESAPLAGGAATVIDAGSPLAVTVDDAAVYWIAPERNAIRRAPLGGGPTRTLGSGTDVRSIAVDAQWIYFGDLGAGGLHAGVLRMTK
jgi:hypothetical protein